jgi:hypothetical protein
MAGRQPERHVPLAPGRILLAESDRDLVRDHHPSLDPTRHPFPRVNTLVAKIRAHTKT